jgi:Ni/Fe-hydrogenase subunit HybB-like protein
MKSDFKDLIPTPMKANFFTPNVKIIFGIMAIGLLAYLYRLIFGLDAATNLNDQYPWGIWIGIDVATGVALAAGGYTTAAIAYIFHQDDYHVIVRPALLTALLGYTFVVIGLLADLGRYYNVWHPMMPSMWQGNSVLFEVGVCVMLYINVLYIEFVPIVVERFKGRVNLPGKLASLNKTSEFLLDLADKTIGRVTWFFIILGVVLSCLHQSSLGALMLVAPTKMHPLWYTPVLPLLFLFSAIAVGFPMVVFESFLSSKSFKLEPEMDLLSSITQYTPIMLALYLALKIGDISIRGAWPYVFDFSAQSIMFLIEITIGIIAPLIILSMDRYRYSKVGLFTGASLVVAGIAINRINVFLVAYKPLYAEKAYYPSIMEILVTAGLICALILIYRLVVMIFPVIAIARDKEKEVRICKK